MNEKKPLDTFGKIAQWVVGLPLIVLVAAGLVSLIAHVVRWGFGG